MVQILPDLPPKHERRGGFAKMAPFARDTSEMTDIQQDALQMQQGMREDSPDLIERMSQTYHFEQDLNQKMMRKKMLATHPKADQEADLSPVIKIPQI